MPDALSQKDELSIKGNAGVGEGNRGCGCVNCKHPQQNLGDLSRAALLVHLSLYCKAAWGPRTKDPRPWTWDQGWRPQKNVELLHCPVATLIRTAGQGLMPCCFLYRARALPNASACICSHFVEHFITTSSWKKHAHNVQSSGGPWYPRLLKKSATGI